MRDTFVDFLEEGAIWVEFCYEFLLEYCFLCGCLCHPSRICIEKVGSLGEENSRLHERMMAFAGSLEVGKLVSGEAGLIVMIRESGVWKTVGVNFFWILRLPHARPDSGTPP